jgi:hypothetical protein
VKSLIKARGIARENSRYDIADKIRSLLEKLGYELRDTKEGTDAIFRSDLSSPIEEEELSQLIEELKKEVEEKPYIAEIISLLEKGLKP